MKSFNSHLKNKCCNIIKNVAINEHIKKIKDGMVFFLPRFRYLLQRIQRIKIW